MFCSTVKFFKRLNDWLEILKIKWVLLVLLEQSQYHYNVNL
jgi:hypothetical protein